MRWSPSVVARLRPLDGIQLLSLISYGVLYSLQLSYYPSVCCISISFKSILIALKSNRLRVSGARNGDLIGRMNHFRDNHHLTSNI